MSLNKGIQVLTLSKRLTLSYLLRVQWVLDHGQ